MEEVGLQTITVTAPILLKGAGAFFSGINTKLKQIKSSDNKQDIINGLDSIINELLEKQSELYRTANTLQSQLDMQTISDDDLKFITENLLPLLENLLKSSIKEEDASKKEKEIKIDENLQVIESLVSTQLLKILQLIGFNIKAAIGAPTTELVKSMIISKVDNGTELQKSFIEYNIEMAKLALNEEAYDRYLNLINKT